MEGISPKEKNVMVIKAAGAFLFDIFGIVGVFYSIWKHNWNSAFWCLLLEISCTMVLMFNKNHFKNELQAKYSANFFRIIKFVAVAMAAGSLVAFIVYIAVGATQQETFNVTSHYLAAPVALMAAFWYSVLFFDCRKYESLLQ